MSPADPTCRWANSPMVRGDLKENGCCDLYQEAEGCKADAHVGKLFVWPFNCTRCWLNKSWWGSPDEPERLAVDAGALNGEQTDSQKGRQAAQPVCGEQLIEDFSKLEEVTDLVGVCREGVSRQQRFTVTEWSWPHYSEWDLPPQNNQEAVEAQHADLGHANDYLPKHSKHVESESPVSPTVNIKHVWYL